MAAGSSASSGLSVSKLPVDGFDGGVAECWSLPLCLEKYTLGGSMGALRRLLACLSACSMRSFRHGSFSAFRRSKAVYVRMKPLVGSRDVMSGVVNRPFEDRDEAVDRVVDGFFVTRIFLDFGPSFWPPVGFRFDDCMVSTT